MTRVDRIIKAINQLTPRELNEFRNKYTAATDVAAPSMRPRKHPSTAPVVAPPEPGPTPVVVKDPPTVVVEEPAVEAAPVDEAKPLSSG